MHVTRVGMEAGAVVPEDLCIHPLAHIVNTGVALQCESEIGQYDEVMY